MLPIIRANLIASGLQAVQQAMQEAKNRAVDPAREPPRSSLLSQGSAYHKNQGVAGTDNPSDPPSTLGSQLDCLL